MSQHPAISSLVAYGTEAEQILLPMLSVAVGEPLTKTGGKMDTMDFEGRTVVGELKKRSSDWSYKNKKIYDEGWLIPSCKIIKGWEQIAAGKRVVFFYFWMEDKSLWMWEMEEDDFIDGGHFIPKNHYDQMLHVAVHQSSWEFVGFVENKFQEEECWISD